MKKLFTLLILLCFTVISANAQRIFGAEYFIDGPDPGPGNGIALKGNFPADSLSISDSISVKGLSSGVHVLYIRCYDSLGVWSHYTPVLFSVEFGIYSQITKAEIFIDNDDPSIGKAKALNGNFPKNIISLTDSLSAAGLGLGVHSINIRAFDEQMMSSVTEKRIFSVIPDNKSNIIYAEWFIDQDPGLGKATSINISKPATRLNLYQEIIVPTLTSGKHFLYIRAKDNKGMWTLYEPKEFNICSTYGPEPDFGYDFVSIKDTHQHSWFTAIFNNNTLYADSFIWKVNNKIISYHKEPSFRFDTIGTYHVCLTAINNCGSSTICKNVVNNGITGISPKSVFYQGHYRINVFGLGFTDQTKFHLYHKNPVSGAEDIINPDTVIFTNQNQLLGIFRKGPDQAMFDDTNNLFYEIILTNGGPSHANYFTKFYFAFQNPKTTKAIFAPKYELVFPPVIRQGFYYDAYYYYDNSLSNIYRVGIPLIIRTSGNLEAVLVTPMNDSGWIDTSAKKIIPWQRFYKFHNDTLNPTDSFNIAMVVLSELYPGDKGYLHFLIKINKSDSFYIEANHLPPLYYDNWLDTIGYRSNCKNLPPCLQCLLDILNLYGAIIPILGCIGSGVDLGCLLGGANPNASFFDYLGGIASLILSCAPGLSQAKGMLDALTNAASLAGNMSGMDSKNDNCRQCFPYPPGGNGGKGVSSYDPNTKFGTSGVKKEHFVKGNAAFNYTIKFENISSATAPAAEVIVSDKIDTSKFDISTLEFIAFGYANNYYEVFPTADSFTFQKSLKPEKNSVLRVRGYYDTLTANLITHFMSMDSVTGKITKFVSDGFLDPNDSNRKGEGFVMFRVKPKEDLPHLTKINNQAEITFDQNTPINTTVWSNTIDKEAPFSSVIQLPAVINDTIFTVKWHGTDNESGIGYYWIYVSENGGQWNEWIRTRGLDSAIFAGKLGQTYSFYCIASDHAGNIEQKAPHAEAYTLISTSIDEPESNLSKSGYMLNIYPNPNKTKTIVLFSLPYSSEINMEVFNSLGQRIDVLSNDYFEKGTHQIELNTNGYQPGIYYILLKNNEVKISKKLIIK